MLPKGSKYPIFKDSGPKTIKGMVLGIRVLKYWVLGPSGLVSSGDFVSALSGLKVCEYCLLLLWSIWGLREMMVLLGSSGTWYCRGLYPIPDILAPNCYSSHVSNT